MSTSKKSSLPTGFANALRNNHEAMDFYNNCTDHQKQAIINQVKNISSKQELKDFVSHLPSAAL